MATVKCKGGEEPAGVKEFADAFRPLCDSEEVVEEDWDVETVE